MTNHKPLRLGDVLLARKLVTYDGLEAALERQRHEGGRLGDNLIALGLMSTEQLAVVLEQTPATPLRVDETGISRASLLALMLKFMRTESMETLPALSAAMKLSSAVLADLMEGATTQRLVEVLGSIPHGFGTTMRYTLSDLGRHAAAEALSQTQYVGPAPVSLSAYQARVRQQAITNENLTEASIQDGFAGLNVPSNFVRKLLPAIRAGRTALLYGPPGNGKTSIGTRIARLFRDMIYIPHAIEVSGQIIKVFDPELHRPFQNEENAVVLSSGNGLLLETFDPRWVACRRPVAMAGGEMTLQMLDLGFDPVSNVYDAPLHMKALNGLFLIDDFGRQQVKPTDLLNRWIVPLESRVDYLKLNTGNSFQIPFDELVVLSTNLDPSDLMDPAFLRRIPYKIEMLGPTEADYRRVFQAVASGRGLAVADEVLDHIIRRLGEKDYALAYFQPNFLCEQVHNLCACFGLPRVFTTELADEALENLYVDLKIAPKTPEPVVLATPEARAA